MSMTNDDLYRDLRDLIDEKHTKVVDEITTMRAEVVGLKVDVEARVTKLETARDIFGWIVGVIVVAIIGAVVTGVFK